MALLEVNGLVRRFRGLAAVDGLSFTVAEGQTVAIIGPNGAGKSTTFNLVSGLLGSDGGSIRFRGTDVTRTPAHSRTRAGMGRTFQVVQPFVDLNVVDNIIVGALFGASVSLGTARADAERLVELVGLGDKRSSPVSALTLADRKRLERARALAAKTALLVVGEVGVGL